jgi:hypothetical protein
VKKEKKMGFLENLIPNLIAADQSELLREISDNQRAQMASSQNHSLQQAFDWDDPFFVSETDKTDDTFYASYSDIMERKKGELKRVFPEKLLAIGMIDRLANEGNLSSLEYIALYREILAPKAT